MGRIASFPMVSHIKRFAITGGIACGKSTVAAWLPQWGGLVLDADDVVHEIEGPGGEAVEPIRSAFGAEIVDARGAVDRVALGRCVFADAAARVHLNAIVHPIVWRRIEVWLSAPSPATCRFRAVLIPLLFEVGWDRVRWDAVIAVVCGEAEQVSRLMGRGLSEAEALLRIAAQLPCAEKARRADYALWNTGSIEALRRAAESLFERLVENTL